MGAVQAFARPPRSASRASGVRRVSEGTKCPTRHTPLWLASHLPLKGGDWPSRRVSPIADVAEGGGINEASNLPP